MEDIDKLAVPILACSVLCARTDVGYMFVRLSSTLVHCIYRDGIWQVNKERDRENKIETAVRREIVNQKNLMPVGKLLVDILYRSRWAIEVDEDVTSCGGRQVSIFALKCIKEKKVAVFSHVFPTRLGFFTLTDMEFLRWLVNKLL